MQVPTITIVARGAGGVLSAALLTACAGDPGAGDRSAGDVGAVPLGEADAAWDEGFSVLSTVRELPGGRVLVADPLGQIVVALDLDAGVADTIGGVGSGPAEYRQPDAVWPLPESRTLLVDLGNGRLTVLSPDLEFGDTRLFATGGTVTSGAPVPWTRRRIGRPERLAWRDSQAETGGGLTVRDERVNGEIRRTVLRPGSREDEAELDSYEWPAFLPPFSDRPILVDGTGRAWVRRHREADGTLQYDLFDGTGAVVLKVVLDSQRRVVGFGDGTLYAVRMDGQGLQYLERYVLP